MGGYVSDGRQSDDGGGGGRRCGGGGASLWRWKEMFGGSVVEEVEDGASRRFNLRDKQERRDYLRDFLELSDDNTCTFIIFVDTKSLQIHPVIFDFSSKKLYSKSLCFLSSLLLVLISLSQSLYQIPSSLKRGVVPFSHGTFFFTHLHWTLLYLLLFFYNTSFTFILFITDPRRNLFLFFLACLSNRTVSRHHLQPPLGHFLQTSPPTTTRMHILLRISSRHHHHRRIASHR